MKKVLFLLLGFFLCGKNLSATVLSDALKLKIQGSTGQDETVIRFLPGCNAAYNNGFDAQKLFSSANVPSIYTKDSSGVKLAINAQGTLNYEYNIPIYLRTNVAVQLTVTSVILGNFNPGVKVILENVQTGYKTDILNSGCTIQLPPTSLDPAASFILHFQVPPEIVAITNASCGGLAGSFVFNKCASSNRMFKVLNDQNAIVHTDVSTQLTDTVWNLNPGNYMVRVFFDSLTYTERSFTVEIQAVPVADFEIDNMTVFVGSQIEMTNTSVGYDQLIWRVNGDSIGNSEEIQYIFNMPGTHEITISAIKGSCIDQRSMQLNVSAVTSIVEKDNSERTFFVNGMPWQVVSESEEVMIYDVNGKLVLKEPFKAGMNLVLSNTLSDGIYLIYTNNRSNRVYSSSIK